MTQQLEPDRRRAAGFTLTDLMVTVAVIGILSSVAIQVSGSEWRRERVNAAVVELSGWLEAVRRAAVKGEGCTVTLAQGSALGGGAQLASSAVRTGITSTIANNCLTALPALLPAVTANYTFTVAAAPTTTFTFTPRGTVSPEPAANAPIEVQITLNGGGPGRCVRVRDLLGLVEIGRLEGTCQYGGAF